MKLRIKYIFLLIVVAFIGAISSVNAVTITKDELGDAIEAIKPDASFAYIIGKYIYTDEMTMSTKDIMLGTLSIDIIDLDGKTNKDNIYDEMRILYAEWIGTDEQGHSKWDIKNYIGTGDIPTSYDLRYVDYQEFKETVKYTVTFNNDGTTSQEIVNDGHTVNRPTDPVKEGYKFIGWYNGDEEYDFSSSVTSDLNLTAKYVVIVDIDTLLQNNINKINNEYYEASYADKVLTYTIINNDINSSALKNTGLIGGIRDLLKTEGIKALTIKFGDKTYVFDEPNENLEAGQSSAAFLTMLQMLEETTGKTVSEITLEDLIGTELDVTIATEGGYVSKEGNTVEQYRAVINGEKTPMYTVTFNIDGKETTKTVKQGTVIEEPVVSEKEGYTFGGWYTDSEFTTKYEFTSEVNSNMTLYAKYDINTYNAKFYDGETELTDLNQTVEYGKTLSDVVAPTKEGYTFNGWYTDNALATEYNVDNLVKANITLYAKYTIKSYDVKFYDDDKELTDLKQTVQYGKTINNVVAPTKEGYKFIGWYTNSDLTTEYNTDNLVKANVTLYAKYEVASYTVKFTGMDNTEKFPDVKVEYKRAVSAPSYTPIKGNAGSMVFAGWYTEDGNLYDFKTPVTSNLVLVAKYTTDTNVVKFYDGETELTDLVQNVAFGQKATSVVAPTKEGYTFDGWYIDSKLTTNYDFEKEVNVDLTLYAKYTINTYTVKFYDGDEEFTDLTKEVEYGKTIGDITSPTKEGYVLVGWYTDSELTTEYNMDTIVKANVTLYVKWKQVVATVTSQTELENALANSDIATINLANDIEVNKSIIISRSVVINGNNNTMSMSNVTSGNNQVLKTYSGLEEINVELKNIKLTGANAALIVLDNSKVTAINVDVSGNAWGGIEVKNVATSSLVATNIANTTEEEGHATIWVDEATVKSMLASISFEDRVPMDVTGDNGKTQTQYYLSQLGNLNDSSDSDETVIQSVTDITADIISNIQTAIFE